ncbi:MAG: methionine adenosyltransferase [Paludibacteraceae bacterium]|nr:methionine adenosyltransferase [Paludibacteraceae bacterium]
MEKTYLFTSESVSEGHPDKVADQISDAILDHFLAQDAESHVACETLVTTGQVVVAGEVTSKGYVDVQRVARETIARIGYTDSAYKFEAESCGILTALHEQSCDIARGVDGQGTENMGEQGAGDQGMMFGYASSETGNYMPLTLDLAHTLVYTLARIRKEGREMTYLRPDAKSQVTIEYNERNEPVRIHTIVVSTQHDPDATQEQIREDRRRILQPRVMKRDQRYERLLAPYVNNDPAAGKLLVNPTGQFVIGGPHGDTGLTGRKIIVDTYGGRGAHGGGAFSGKDPSKVDRSAAYAARWIAKNMVAAGVAREMLVQVSYAIGVAKPVNVFVNTYGTGIVSDSVIAERVNTLFDLTPAGIIRDLNLKQPMYEETASYGHMGRKPETVKKRFLDDSGRPFERDVELFTWERLDRVEQIRQAFHI